MHPRRPERATSPAARGTAAFGGLYREHFDGLYDFVIRIVRDHDLTGEVVQATFTKAWNELRAGRELTYPKSWLYTVARNHALDELRRRRRLADEPLAYAEPDPSRMSDPQAVAEANEIVDLVWDSAAALTPDEYSLLDLHVRHGFDAPDLADALGLERGAVYTRLSRLRRSLESSVASTLLVRRGGSECEELAAIVAEHDDGAEITPALRRAVQSHVDDCEICSAERTRFLSPLALFGALTPIAPLGPAREGILHAILPGGAGAAGAGAGAGAVASARHGAKARYLLVGSGGLAATAAAVALAMSGGGAPSDPARAFSADHTVGVASSDQTVTMRWSPGKNAKGYSVIFSQNRNAEPPARENVRGTEVTSAPLAAGSWWFILRTHGKDGSWTHTLRRGPFVITVPTAAVPAPKPAAKPARKKPARKARPRAKVASPRPTATPAPPGQLVAGERAAPRRAPPKPNPPAPKPKKKKPKKPPPASPQAPAPPAVTAPPAATPSPPAASPPPSEPVAPVPPAQHGDDDEGEKDDDDEHDDDNDEDHQGEDHGGHGDGGHGHGDD
ncbi:MAG TPA: sigma-70 family RNA polymerase sigma factor [Thermoleophilaceae bacterium]